MVPEVVPVTIVCTGTVHAATVEIASAPDGSTTWTVRPGHDEVEAVAEAFM